MQIITDTNDISDMPIYENNHFAKFYLLNNKF